MANLNGSSTKTFEKSRHLKITYTDPDTKQNDISVYFKLRCHSVVEKWKERLLSAQKLYEIDDPKRFYGLGDLESQIKIYYNELHNCINLINQHDKIITRKINDSLLQDDLNYLHHIFEVYHGLLDKQTHDFYLSAPTKVKTALANLNILVHKGESLIRGAAPRHVVTYFGLPKTKKLYINDYELFTDHYQFGTVYLNYVEIGKTLEDLSMDDDHYISDDAFRPFRFYSADFVVMFYNGDPLLVEEKRKRIKKYYYLHKKFFTDRFLPFNHPHLKPGRIPLANIDSHGMELLQLLETRQYVKSVELV